MKYQNQATVERTSSIYYSCVKWKSCTVSLGKKYTIVTHSGGKPFLYKGNAHSDEDTPFSHMEHTLPLKVDLPHKTFKLPIKSTPFQMRVHPPNQVYTYLRWKVNLAIKYRPTPWGCTIPGSPQGVHYPGIPTRGAHVQNEGRPYPWSVLSSNRGHTFHKEDTLFQIPHRGYTCLHWR